MLTIQATAAQAMLARGLAAADIARAALPAMRQAMPALIQDSRHLIEAVAAATAQGTLPAHQALARTCSTGAVTALAAVIPDTQVQPAQAALLTIALTVVLV